MYKSHGEWLRKKPSTHLWPPYACTCGRMHTDVHKRVPPHKDFAKVFDVAYLCPVSVFCWLGWPQNMNFKWHPLIPEWQWMGIMTFPEELTLIPWIRIWRSWHFILSKHMNSKLRTMTGGCSKVSRHMLSTIPYLKCHKICKHPQTKDWVERGESASSEDRQETSRTRTQPN